jgi:hypothetical protein
VAIKMGGMPGSRKSWIFYFSLLLSHFYYLAVLYPTLALNFPLLSYSIPQLMRFGLSDGVKM